MDTAILEMTSQLMEVTSVSRKMARLSSAKLDKILVNKINLLYEKAQLIPNARKIASRHVEKENGSNY